MQECQKSETWQKLEIETSVFNFRAVVRLRHPICLQFVALMDQSAAFMSIIPPYVQNQSAMVDLPTTTVLISVRRVGTSEDEAASR